MIHQLMDDENLTANKLSEDEYCKLLSASVEYKASAVEFPKFVFRNWQVQSLVSSNLMQGMDKDKSSSREKLFHTTNAIRAFSKVQLNALMEVCRAFSGQIEYSLLKSSALRVAYYDDPISRVGWDIDIAVDKENIPAATVKLQALGYEFSQFDSQTKHFSPADPMLRAAVEAKHYELGFLARRNRITGLSQEQMDSISRVHSDGGQWHIGSDGQFYCYTTVDVHHGLSLDLSVANLVKEGVEIEFEGQGISIPRASWLAFHVIYKIYWEGVHAYGKGLYQYADLVRLIKKLSEVEVLNLIKLIDDSNLRVAALYVLRRLPYHFDTLLHPHLQNYLDTTMPKVGSDPMKLNDLGDMWEKLWGRYGVADVRCF